eukprot:GDKJ01027931.1.p1 GENE.GDKJ01027931.1~~GDKJ01027931.1.p1  ORF type:complete len:694 (-),score=173.96 GDKJ01027931.1:119-2200(-)
MSNTVTAPNEQGDAFSERMIHAILRHDITQNDVFYEVLWDDGDQTWIPSSHILNDDIKKHYHRYARGLDSMTEMRNYRIDYILDVRFNEVVGDHEFFVQWGDDRPDIRHSWVAETCFLDGAGIRANLESLKQHIKKIHEAWDLEKKYAHSQDVTMSQNSNKNIAPGYFVGSEQTSNDDLYVVADEEYQEYKAQQSLLARSAGDGSVIPDTRDKRVEKSSNDQSNKNKVNEEITAALKRPRRLNDRDRRPKVPGEINHNMSDSEFSDGAMKLRKFMPESKDEFEWESSSDHNDEERESELASKLARKNLPKITTASKAAESRENQAHQIRTTNDRMVKRVIKKGGSLKSEEEEDEEQSRQGRNKTSTSENRSSLDGKKVIDKGNFAAPGKNKKSASSGNAAAGSKPLSAVVPTSLINIRSLTGDDDLEDDEQLHEQEVFGSFSDELNKVAKNRGAEVPKAVQVPSSLLRSHSDNFADSPISVPVLRPSSPATHAVKKEDGKGKGTNKEQTAKHVVSEDEEDEESEFEVESIIAERKNGKDATKDKILIKWKGYSQDDNTWEPLCNMNATESIEDFHARVSADVKRPVFAYQWAIQMYSPFEYKEINRQFSNEIEEAYRKWRMNSTQDVVKFTITPQNGANRYFTPNKNHVSINFARMDDALSNHRTFDLIRKLRYDAKEEVFQEGEEDYFARLP